MRISCWFKLIFFISLCCQNTTYCCTCITTIAKFFEEAQNICTGIFYPVIYAKHLYFEITDDIDKIREMRFVRNENKNKGIYMKKNYCEIGEFTDVTKNFKILNENMKKIVCQERATKIIRQSVISIMQKYYEFDFNKKRKMDEKKEMIEKIKKLEKEKNTKKSKIKKEIRDFEKKFESENNKYFKNGPGCTFLYFIGPAGTGKTEAALSIIPSLSSNNKPAYVIDASTVLMNNGKFSELFKPIKRRKKNVHYIQSDLATYIKTVKRGIIIFNEIDKILKNNSLADDLCEFLRTMKDNNYYVDEQGKQVDVSGFVFIFTSNEKIDKNQDDKTGSMIDVYSDQSFKTRFMIISFDNFSSNGYEQLIKKYYKSIKKNFTETYKEFEIELLFDKEIEKQCAEYIYGDKELRNRGARAIYDVLGDNLNAVLFEKIEILKSNCILNKKKFYISFDDENKEFVINNDKFFERKIRKQEQKKKSIKPLLARISCTRK